MTQGPAREGASTRDLFLLSPVGASMIVIYYILVVGLLLVRSKRASLSLLSLMMIKNTVFPVLAALTAAAV